MRLSVIIPVLNEADCIENSLRQLQSLREQGHELIVVDGGSIDATVRIAQPLADHIRACGPGRAGQMNAGAALAAHSGLLFLHADTRLPPSGAALVCAALANPATPWGRFDVRLSGNAWLLRIVERTMNLRSRWTGIATGDQALFVRREVFEGLGGYTEQPLMEDIELSKRLKRVRRPVCIGEPVITSSRRWEARGVCRTILLMWWLRLGYFCGASPDRLAQRYNRPSGHGSGARPAASEQS